MLHMNVTEHRERKIFFPNEEIVIILTFNEGLFRKSVSFYFLEKKISVSLE